MMYTNVSFTLGIDINITIEPKPTCANKTKTAVTSVDVMFVFFESHAVCFVRFSGNR